MLHDKPLNVIITGTTGMVGEGVLQTCLAHPSIANILSVTRKPCGYTDAKLTELLVSDFTDLSAVTESLKGYDACYFCAGVSSVGMSEDAYYNLTYELTLSFAKQVLTFNPEMTFCYVSGAYTDGTEKGRSMWARIKGKTENDLVRLTAHAYNFRPGVMQPRKDAKHLKKFYKLMGVLLPVIKILFAKNFCLLEDVGQAMVEVTLYGYDQHVLEVADIKLVSSR